MRKFLRLPDVPCTIIGPQCWPGASTSLLPPAPRRRGCQSWPCDRNEEGVMQFGVVLPFVDARTAAGLSQEAEASEWDAVFVWDTIGMFDPWVTLAAIAMCTDRMRMGPMVTPVSRRRPWKLACE